MHTNCCDTPPLIHAHVLVHTSPLPLPLRGQRGAHAGTEVADGAQQCLQLELLRSPSAANAEVQRGVHGELLLLQSRCGAARAEAGQLRALQERLAQSTRRLAQARDGLRQLAQRCGGLEAEVRRRAAAGKGQARPNSPVWDARVRLALRTNVNQLLFA